LAIFIYRKAAGRPPYTTAGPLQWPELIGGPGYSSIYYALVILSCCLLLAAPSPSGALPLEGGPHDRSSDPAYTASGIGGICDECHLVHYAPEMVQYKRDLIPDAAKSSELCLDCHDGSPPPWASTARDQTPSVTSLHDFSSRPIGQGGVCWPCHDLHLPDPATASFAGSGSGSYFTDSHLWKRDLSGELTQFYQKRELGRDSDPAGGPNYLVGSTVFCYDCHAGDARSQGSDTTGFKPDDADFTDAPQDIAFAGDRDVTDGNVGYYELPTGDEPDAGTEAPSLSAIVNSPYNPDVVPGGHYVRSRMNNDGTPEEDNYEVRDPEGNLLYRISIGDKLPCELCHDPHLKESSLGSSPPDQVFFRRDIHTGEEQIIDRSSESYFGARLDASGFTRNGDGGVGDGRRMCQYCHGTGDWDESQNPGPSGGIAPLIVDWTSRTTVYGIQIRTAGTPGGSKAFPPPPLVYHAKDDNQPACARCHRHNNVSIDICNGCHGGAATGAENFWPDDTPLPPIFPDNAGSHNDHVTIIEARNALAGDTSVERQNATCDWCHPDPGGVNVDGAIHRVNTAGSAGTTADLNQDAFNPTTYFRNIVPLMGSYDISGPAGTATYNQATGQCSNLYCHGDYLGGGNASPTWGSAATGGCGTCHPDDSSQDSGSHSKHVGTAPGEYGTRISCAGCHLDVSGAGAAAHWDMIANVTISSGYGSAAAYSPASNGGTPAVGDTYGGCYSLDCHGASMPSGAAGADTTPVWGNAATGQCGSCHLADGSPDITSGSHTIHLDTGSGVYGSNIRYDCSRCHNLVDTADNGFAEINSVQRHADAATDIDFDSFNADARTYQATGTDQCSGLYCHGNFPGGNTNNAATWGSPASGTCGTCHGSDASATPASGSHVSHLSTVPQGPGAVCDDCHGAGAATATHADHMDGTISIDAALGYAPSTGTCAGTVLGLGCHNSYDTPAWGSAADCTACHQADAPPDDGDADPFSALHYVDPAYTTVQAHDQDLWIGTMGGQSGCETCHSSAPSDLHYNGTVQYSADTINFASSVNFADSAVPTCAPDGGNYTGCHSD